MQSDVVHAIRAGDLEAVRGFLSENPEAVRARIDGQRTLLHVATDWPGQFPRVQDTIRLLAQHGADVNAPFQGGKHTETPLHWAASSDDLSALDALLDLGADIEAPGSVIDGGTPLADAVAFGQWNAARRLIERGARTTLWQAAALGLIDRLRDRFAESSAPSPDDLAYAFWSACHGGQIEAAQVLLGRGAALNWVGHGGLTPLDAALRNGNQELVNWLVAQGAVSSNGSHVHPASAEPAV